MSREGKVRKGFFLASVALMVVVAALLGARYQNNRSSETIRNIEADVSPSLQASRDGAADAAETARRAAKKASSSNGL